LARSIIARANWRAYKLSKHRLTTSGQASSLPPEVKMAVKRKKAKKATKRKSAKKRTAKRKAAKKRTTKRKAKKKKRKAAKKKK
jgi:hypothetical protein